MPKACVTKKMKQGMSPAKAVAACYPKATEAVKSAAIAAIPGVGAAVGVKRAMDRRAIKKSKPKKLSIRRDVPEMEKRRRKNKAKSMKKSKKKGY